MWWVDPVPSSAGQGWENRMQASWSNHSPITNTGTTDSAWENQLNLLPVKSEMGNEESLTGLAMASGGSVLEPVAIGSVRHRGSFWYLLIETTPAAAHYKKLAMQTQYILVKSPIARWQCNLLKIICLSEMTATCISRWRMPNQNT